MDRQRIALFVTFLASLACASAQQGDPFAIDTVNRIELESGLAHGDYRRAMDPEATRSLGLSGKGTAALGDWDVGGRFGYRRQARRGVYFSGVADAYDGNPYFWGDSLSGDWRDDVVVAGASLHAPWQNGRRLGLSLDYRTATGVRTSDPKPLYRLRDAAISLSYHQQFSPRFALALKPGYRHVFEENEIGYLSQNNAFVIRSRGYGSLLEGSLVRMDRRRMSSDWHLEAGIQRAGGAYVALAASIRTDRVSEGLADPVPDGDYRRSTFSVRGAYPLGRWTPALSGRYFTGVGESFLGSLSESGDYHYAGIQHVYDDRWEGRASIDWKPRYRSPIQVAGGGLSLNGDRQEDALSESVYTHTDARLDAHVAMDFRAFEMHFGMAYRRNLAAAAGTTYPTRLSQSLFQRDFRYATADALLWEVSSRWYCGRVVNGVDNGFWLGLMHSGGAASANRRLVYAVSLGIDFNR